MDNFIIKRLLETSNNLDEETEEDILNIIQERNQIRRDEDFLI